MRPRFTLALALLLCLAPHSARAGLSLCNDTTAPISASVAHHDGAGWVSVGWWAVPPGKCAQLLEGDLIARYYYLHAEHVGPGGGWTGDSMFCIGEDAFEARGRGKCEERGFARAGFFEVDTGSLKDFTQRLSD